MITSEYKCIFNSFIKEEILLAKNLSEIDPQDIRSQKPISDICLGGQCLSQLLNDPLQDESCAIRLISDCFKFLSELSLQIKKRLPFDENAIIPKLNVLDIEIACDLERSTTSIVPLAVHFPHIIPQNKLNKLDDQWRAFRISAKKLAVSAKCVPEYWHNLSLVKDGLDNLKFSRLSYSITTMTVLPHSSAAVERIFSQINRMKTKSNSSLESETVENRLLAKQSINRKNQTCCCWEPNQKLITEMMDGTVRKRYQERLVSQKYKDVCCYSESDNEEETVLTDDYNILTHFFRLFVNDPSAYDCFNVL